MARKEIVDFCVFPLCLKWQFPGFAYVGFKDRILCFECSSALTLLLAAKEIAAEETRPWGREALSSISLYGRESILLG